MNELLRPWTSRALLLLLALSLTACGEPSSAPDVDSGITAGDAAAATDAGEQPDAMATLDDAGGPAPDAAMPSDCPQADDFLDVSTGSAGPGYAAPELSVSCVGAEVVVTSNGIPNFEFVPTTPNALREQALTYRFPRVPARAASSTDVPLGGAAAVAVNGLPIFGPTEAPMMGYRDPVLDSLLDYCNGHTAPGGVYHFHARPDCLFTDLEGNTSLVIAYAFDGYPILAPYACEDDACTRTRELRSSWQRVASQFDASGDPLYIGTTEGSWDVHEYVAGSGDLDECNGRELAGGGYAYYATDTFPYFVGCYRGTPTLPMMGGMRP